MTIKRLFGLQCGTRAASWVLLFLRLPASWVEQFLVFLALEDTDDHYEIIQPLITLGILINLL
jgi:hypothetical protein